MGSFWEKGRYSFKPNVGTFFLLAAFLFLQVLIYHKPGFKSVDEEWEALRKRQIELYTAEIPHITEATRRRQACSNQPELISVRMPTGGLRGDDVLLPRVDTRKDLATLANKMGLTGQAAELGVHRGEFSAEILSTWNGAKLHLVDIWAAADFYKADRTDDYQIMLETVAPYKDRVVINRNWTFKAVEEYPDNYFDWIYLDATHTYYDARRDLQLWWPKLKKGGLMSGHDYLNGIVAGYVFGVKDVVDEFAAIWNYRVHITTSPSRHNTRSWFFVKCD